MPSPNLSELVTTTLRNRRGRLADNVLNNIPLLMRLKERGNTELEGGGRTLVEEVEYAENSTYQRYDGFEVLNTGASDVFTSAEFNWKQAAVNVAVSGKEARQNSGAEQSIRLVASRVKNAEKTMMNNIASDLFSDGTASSGKQVGGLQSIIADDPTTGTVGGINRATFTFWRNITFDATTDGGAAATAALIQGYMQTVWLNTVRNGEHTDMIVADSNYFPFFWESLTTIQRITNVQKGASGFQSLEFNGPGGSATVFFDGNAPANHMYFINSDYLHWRVHRDANFEAMEPRDSINQDAFVRPLIFMGNMTTSGAKYLGILKD